ncbi:hypothetical protein JGUZn3_10390 [Entomobacter blattae]|uniref:Uncharacterized protein n=1 Tax=Entomobacter blattae TaxID=2762277 RepID=A0A7H1NR57_9PROT|nr:hypothetical protein JGUZn3_10390 [Entomobacter blattae]
MSSCPSSYPKAIAEELEHIEEPGIEEPGIEESGIFIVDDVAFVHAEHGMAIANEIKKRGIKKEYYLETRGDVLLHNKEVFKVWSEIGLRYMFIGMEAVDAEGLKQYADHNSDHNSGDNSGDNSGAFALDI